MQAEKILRAKDVATLLGVSYDKALAFMKDGRMRVLAVGGGRYGVTESELARWQRDKAQAMPVATPKKRKQTFHYDPTLFDENGKIRKVRPGR